MPYSCDGPALFAEDDDRRRGQGVFETRQRLLPGSAFVRRAILLGRGPPHPSPFSEGRHPILIPLVGARTLERSGCHRPLADRVIDALARTVKAIRHLGSCRGSVTLGFAVEPAVVHGVAGVVQGGARLHQALRRVREALGLFLVHLVRVRRACMGGDFGLYGLLKPHAVPAAYCQRDSSGENTMQINHPMPRRHPGLRPIAVAVAVVAASLAIAACSSSGSSSTPTPASAAASNSSGSALVKVASDSKFGQILESSSGMPLYTYDKDTSGKSNCTGGCLTEWPALAATGSSAPSVAGASGAFSLVKRDDGTMQVAYNGMPLYTFVDDKAGDVTGDGQDGFHIATAGAAAAASSATAASTSNGGYNGY